MLQNRITFTIFWIKTAYFLDLFKELKFVHSISVTRLTLCLPDYQAVPDPL